MLLCALVMVMSAAAVDAKKKPPTDGPEQGFWLCKAENDKDIAAQGCDGSGTVCWCCYEDGCYFCDVTVAVGGCWSFRRPPRFGETIRTPLGPMTINPGTGSGPQKPQLMTPRPNLQIAP